MRATGSSIFLDNVSTLFGGIHNSGVISSTSFAGVVVDNVFTFSGGITNLSGGTIGAAKTGVLVENGSTFSGGISNAGALSAGSAGLELRIFPASPAASAIRRDFRRVRDTLIARPVRQRVRRRNDRR